MSDTTRIPEEKLEQYFDDFTKRFLRDGAPESADVELISAEFGIQTEASGVRLIGISYDHHALDFEFDSGEHRVFEPREVWALEEDDGFVSAIEVVRPDGTREVANVRRASRRSD